MTKAVYLLSFYLMLAGGIFALYALVVEMARVAAAVPANAGRTRVRTWSWVVFGIAILASGLGYAARS
jgi:hypothetical protein